MVEEKTHGSHLGSYWDNRVISTPVRRSRGGKHFVWPVPKPLASPVKTSQHNPSLLPALGTWKHVLKLGLDANPYVLETPRIGDALTQNSEPLAPVNGKYDRGNVVGTNEIDTKLGSLPMTDPGIPRLIWQNF